MLGDDGADRGMGACGKKREAGSRARLAGTGAGACPVFVLNGTAYVLLTGARPGGGRSAVSPVPAVLHRHPVAPGHSRHRGGEVVVRAEVAQQPRPFSPQGEEHRHQDGDQALRRSAAHGLGAGLRGKRARGHWTRYASGARLGIGKSALRA